MVRHGGMGHRKVEESEEDSLFLRRFIRRGGLQVKDVQVGLGVRVGKWECGSRFPTLVGSFRQRSASRNAVAA